MTIVTGNQGSTPQPQQQPVELIGREKQRMYKAIAPKLTGAVPCEAAANLIEIPQTVYEGCRLIAVQHTQMFPPMTKYALVKPGKSGDSVVVFDWTAATVHKANAMTGLKVTDTKAMRDYARFYLNRVRPMGETLRLIEDPRQLNLTGEPDSKLLDAMKHIQPLKPVMVEMQQKDGKPQTVPALLGTLAMGDALYQTVFFVTDKMDVIARPGQMIAKGVGMRPDAEMPVPGSAGSLPLEAFVLPQPGAMTATKRAPRGK